MTRMLDKLKKDYDKEVSQKNPSNYKVQGNALRKRNQETEAMIREAFGEGKGKEK